MCKIRVKIHTEGDKWVFSVRENGSAMSRLEGFLRMQREKLMKIVKHRRSEVGVTVFPRMSNGEEEPGQLWESFPRR